MCFKMEEKLAGGYELIYRNTLNFWRSSFQNYLDSLVNLFHLEIGVFKNYVNHASSKQSTLEWLKF